MLTIRLRRTGAKKDPHYRVVVADRAAGRDGAFLEILGHYHPRQQPAEVVFNMERTETWLGQGARMSDTVRSLYLRAKRGSVEEVPEAPSDAELEAAVEVEATDVSADAEGDPVAQQATDEADAEPAADANAAGGEVEGDVSAEEAEEKSNEV